MNSVKAKFEELSARPNPGASGYLSARNES